MPIPSAVLSRPGAPLSVDVAIVIVTYNSAHVIEPLLDSLPSAVGALTVEVIVVDNGSRDGTAELVAGRADCLLIRSTNNGYAGGVVRGIAAAHDFRSVLVLNPDVRLDPGCLPAMIKALGLPRTGIVAPRIRTDDGRLFHSLRREPSLLRATGLTRTGLALLSECVSSDEDYARPMVVDWALGALLLISAECLGAVGWDTSYFLYSEETDFCLRAGDLGYLTRYEPAASAVHIGGQSGRNERTYAMQVINRARLYARRHDPVRSWLYFGLLLAREALFAARSEESRSAVSALLRPRRRPQELGCSDRLMPR